MLSIIICSVSPEMSRNVCENIAATIGVEHECIVIDNRQQNLPIAQVYNAGARKARFPYLFFVHEDVFFHTSGWGEVVEKKLHEKTCGGIGFAGSKVKPRSYSGWGTWKNWDHCCYLQRENGKRIIEKKNEPAGEQFAQVVTLDGFAIFVRREAWQKFPFDEAMLTGFHCYDLDFTMQLHALGGYKNYVCYSPQVWIEHFSSGSFRLPWLRESIRLHDVKWRDFLPLSVGDTPLSKRENATFEENMYHRFVRKSIKMKYEKRGRLLLREYSMTPLSYKHWGHVFSDTFLYFSYFFRQPTK